MRMPLKLLLLLLAISIAPSVAAMSLGEGKIRSHIGEPFLADISLLGSYSKDVRFSQVNSAECRSSIIGVTANGCDALYEGRLSFSIKQRPDSQHYLSVAGERSEEMFYRVIIKSESQLGGTVFNAFVFLPEFKVDSESAPVVSSESVVSPEMSAALPKNPVTEKTTVPVSKPLKATLPEEIKPERKPKARVQPVAVVQAAGKAADAQLQIKKHGEYADDIYALEKENIKIEQQIVLLEKHISLLKEVIRLKSEVGASATVEVGVTPALPVTAPVLVTVPPTAVTAGQNILTWLLLAVVLVLSALLWWVYRKFSSLKPEVGSVISEKSVPPHLMTDARASLDLTNAFVKPKW